MSSALSGGQSEAGGLRPRTGEGGPPPLRPDATTRPPTRRAVPAASRPHHAVLLSAIVALGLALRLHGLGDRPFWVDEAATLGIAQLGWADFLRHVAWVEANPPAYYVLIKLWLGVGPAEEWWLRLPSALAGAAAVPLMYLFCRRAFGSVRAALIGALLLAVAPAHVRFSQEARTYALLFLALLASMLAAQALIAAETPRRRWALAALLAPLASIPMALHGTGAIAAAAVFVHAGATLLARRQFLDAARLAPLVAAGLGALLLAMPWLLRALAIVADAHTVMSWNLPLTAAEALERVPPVLLAPYLGRLALPSAALHLGALALAVVLCRREPEFFGCLAALGFALLVLVLVSLSVEAILFERTVLFTLIFWLAALAAGLAAIRRPAAVALALALLLVPQARSLENHARMNHYEEYWDALAGRIAAAQRPGEAVIGIGVFESVATRHYLRRAAGGGAGGGGAGPALVVIGLGYEAPFLPMARAMLAPRAAWSRPGPAELCAALGAAPGLWIAGRELPSRHVRAELEPMLRELGARPIESQEIGSLHLARWSAPERCPAPAG